MEKASASIVNQSYPISKDCMRIAKSIIKSKFKMIMIPGGAILSVKIEDGARDVSEHHSCFYLNKKIMTIQW